MAKKTFIDRDDEEFEVEFDLRAGEWYADGPIISIQNNANGESISFYPENANDIKELIDQGVKEYNDSLNGRVDKESEQALELFNSTSPNGQVYSSWHSLEAEKVWIDILRKAKNILNE